MAIERTRTVVALYGKPDPEGPVLVRLPANQKVTVLETDGDWSHVVTNTGLAGWCQSSMFADKDMIADMRSRHRDRLLWGAAILFTALGFLGAVGGNGEQLLVGFVLLATAGSLLISLLIERWWPTIIRRIRRWRP